MDKVYGKLLDTLDEGDNPFSFVIVDFNICQKEDPEEHVHLQFSMRKDEEGNLLFDNHEVVKEVSNWLVSPRVKFADFVFHHVFVDEIIDPETPAIINNQVNLANFTHFINKLEYSPDHSDKYFTVFAPVPIATLERTWRETKPNEYFDKPLKQVLFKVSEIKETLTKEMVPGEFTIDLP